MRVTQLWILTDGSMWRSEYNCTKVQCITQWTKLVLMPTYMLSHHCRLETKHSARVLNKSCVCVSCVGDSFRTSFDPEPVVSVCALISPRPRNPAPTQGCSDTPFFTTPMCRRNTKPAPRTSLDVYFGRNLLAAKLKEVQTLAYKVRLSVRCFTK